MDQQRHWEQVYSAKAPDQVSWFRPHLDQSLTLIARAAANLSAPIVDVGGGASTLVDDLLARGYRDITVLDISSTAIEIAKQRLGDVGQAVHWMIADVTRLELPRRAFEVWHDRAVFHFLASDEDRGAYVKNVIRAVRPGGHAIVSTFGPQGPLKCSGLEVVRYDASSLHHEFGGRFRLLESTTEEHRTPFGSTQQFVYCYCVLDG